MSETFNFAQSLLPIVVTARDLATHLGSKEVAPEHLWLGIVHHQRKLVDAVSQRTGLDMSALTARIERESTMGEPQPPAAELPYSPAGKQVLLGALAESARLGDNETRPDHLLIAILREKTGPNIARNICLEVGLTADNLIAALRGEE